MDKIQKFLAKLSKKQRLLILKIILDVQVLDLDGYDVKALKGNKDVFRIRKGPIRIIFRQSKGRGLILKLAFRKDAY